MTGRSCQICASAAVVPVTGYDKLSRVTSDCKPWPAGGHLSVCLVCGCPQKIMDSRWRAEVDEDNNRAGAAYMGLPARRPQEVEMADRVFIALPTVTADAVRPRLGRAAGVDWRLPPPFPISGMDNKAVQP